MRLISPRPANWPPRMSARSRTRARSTVTHKETAHSVRRLTKTRPLAAGGATPRVGGHRSADGCLRNPASTSPWYGAEPLRYPACRAIARAAPPRRVRRLHPAWLAGIDEGLDFGCAASSAAPSTHGAPGQLGALDTHRVVARRPVRVRPSGGLLAARCRLERSQCVLGLMVVHSRASVARNSDIESSPLAVFHLIPYWFCVIYI